MSILAGLGMAAIILLAVVRVFLGFSEADSPQMMGYRIGTLFGMLLLPAVIAYAIAGRKAARNPNRFALCFCLIGALSILMNSKASGDFQTETPDQWVGRLMREAAGLQPVHETGSSSHRQLATLIREKLKKVLQLNKDYTEATDKLDVSEESKLNLPESFVKPRLAAKGLAQLHAAYDLDSQQERKLKELMDDMRRAMASVDMSASEREQMLQGFDKGFNTQMATRQQVIAAETAWIQAVDDEYAYAADHQKDFVFQGGELAIRSDAVRQEFNARISAQNTAQEQFLKMQEDFAKSQQAAMRRFGLNPDGPGFR